MAANVLKAKELRNMSVEELQEKVNQLKKELMQFRFQAKTGKLERASGVEVHHGSLRFAWKIVAPDGKVVGQGFDYGELAEDGRLRKIVGFFGPFPDLESSH